MRIKRTACAALLLCLLLLLGGCARREQPLPAGMDGTQVIAEAITVAEELCGPGPVAGRLGWRNRQPCRRPDGQKNRRNLCHGHAYLQV